MTEMLATPRNMSKVADRVGVMAWSPNTGESYSATAGDYWNRPPDEPLLDSESEPMILAREVTTIEPILEESPEHEGGTR